MQCFCSRLAQKKRKGKNEDKEKRSEDFLFEKGKKERSCLSAGRGDST